MEMLCLRYFLTPVDICFLIKLDIDKNTYMIVDLTTNSKNILQSYDWIGFTVFRDDGKFTTILEEKLIF